MCGRFLNVPQRLLCWCLHSATCCRMMSLKAPWPFSLFHSSQVNFSDDSDLEDPLEVRLAEGAKRRGAASRGRGRGRGQARKGPSLKTDAVTAPGGTPGHSGLSGRSRRPKKAVSGHREELGPEIMRTIPEEEMTDNQMEMSFEILRGSDGEELTSGIRAGVGGIRYICFQGAALGLKHKK